MTKQPPTTLRIPAKLRERVETWAAGHVLSRNAAYVRLIELGLVGREVVAPQRPAPKLGSDDARSFGATLERAAMDHLKVHVDVPILARKTFNPQPKTGKK